jgi:hypothetical protein
MASKEELALVHHWADMIGQRIAQLRAAATTLQTYLDTKEPIRHTEELLYSLINDRVAWAVDVPEGQFLEFLNIVQSESINGNEIDFDDFDYSQAKFYILRGLKQGDEMTTYAVHEDRHKLMTAIEHLPSKRDGEEQESIISPLVYVIIGLPESVDAFAQSINYHFFNLLMSAVSDRTRQPEELDEFIPEPDQSLVEMFENIFVQALFRETPPRMPMIGTIIFSFPGLTDERTLMATWVRRTDSEEFEDEVPLVTEVVEGFLNDKNSPQAYNPDTEPR